MKVQYINPFIKATINVFKTLLGAKAEPGKPVLYNPDSNNLKFDVSGIISLSGEVLGVIAISFPKLTALKIVSRLERRVVKIFDNTVTDAIGEIVNIVAGNSKKDMEEFRIVISLPSIVRGKKHNISWITGVPVIAIPFSSDLGNFYLFVSLKDLIV